MKIKNLVKDKKLVVGADFAGFPLKEVVCEHLRKKGWDILDLGVKKDSDPNDTDLMFHRVGLRVGAEISEGNYERALVFCGTGMGILMLLNVTLSIYQTIMNFQEIYS